MVGFWTKDLNLIGSFHKVDKKETCMVLFYLVEHFVHYKTQNLRVSFYLYQLLLLN